MSSLCCQAFFPFIGVTRTRSANASISSIMVLKEKACIRKKNEMFLYGDEDEGILLIVPAILPLSLNYILLFFHSPCPSSEFSGFHISRRFAASSVSIGVCFCPLLL